jgi:YebC/PmpR family DNA-binding regulatory protein
VSNSDKLVFVNIICNEKIMAGHSKFKNIQHRKGAQDKKKAKLFTKLVREIIIAAKSGGIDANINPRLRNSIAAARSQNLPKERIDKALAQASDPTDLDNYTECRYEGFYPGGIALIVETLSDNKNRTVSDVRSAFNKYGGNLAETGSVSFMFDHVGKIELPKNIASYEEIFESAIDSGAQDVEEHEDSYIIYTEIESFTASLDFLTEKYVAPLDSGLEWKPQNTILIEDEEKAQKLIKLIDLLEESDDVQTVFGNYEFSDAIITKLMS